MDGRNLRPGALLKGRLRLLDAQAEVRPGDVRLVKPHGGPVVLARVLWSYVFAEVPSECLTMVLVSAQPCLCARCHRLTESWFSLLLRRSPWARMLLKKERPSELWRFRA